MYVPLGKLLNVYMPDELGVTAPDTGPLKLKVAALPTETGETVPEIEKVGVTPVLPGRISQILRS